MGVDDNIDADVGIDAGVGVGVGVGKINSDDSQLLGKLSLTAAVVSLSVDC